MLWYWSHNTCIRAIPSEQHNAENGVLAALAYAELCLSGLSFITSLMKKSLHLKKACIWGQSHCFYKRSKATQRESSGLVFTFSLYLTPLLFHKHQLKRKPIQFLLAKATTSSARKRSMVAHTQSYHQYRLEYENQISYICIRPWCFWSSNLPSSCSIPV